MDGLGVDERRVDILGHGGHVLNVTSSSRSIYQHIKGWYRVGYCSGRNEIDVRPSGSILRKDDWLNVTWRLRKCYWIAIS